MAKVDENKSVNYVVERVRTPMSREKLNALYSEFKSDDDYLNYHMDIIEDTHPKFKVTIINDERKSPIKNSEEDASYGFMEKDVALEFIEDCINSNRVSSKPKAVMQNGLSKKAVDRYNEIVSKEEEESEAIAQFTKPTFDEVMNNIYVNTYNGSTYKIKEADIPDDLREDVGVIIPGLIETKEEYFEFVKRLKDRGKNGLGRSIYERYEDYEEAKDLIETYKQAVFDKYGGKEEYFYAKDLGGIFGAYEYYPTVKPRFKKTARNIKMDKGINLNELALVKDMGKRIREELNDEIEEIEVDGSDYKLYDNTPPKFKDLPEDLKLLYKTDQYNINGFTQINNFKSINAYAEELIRSGDPDKQLEGYLIKESLESEKMLTTENYYDSDFINIGDIDDLSLNAVVGQLEYDKRLYENDYDIETAEAKLVNNEYIKEGYRKFLEAQLVAMNGYDLDKVIDKNKVNALTKYAVDYTFSKQFQEDQLEHSKMNSVAENLFVKKGEAKFSDSVRAEVRKGESKVSAYVRALGQVAKDSLKELTTDADNVNKSTMSRHEATYGSVDPRIDGFYLETKPEHILKYMKENEELAKKIYELTSEKDGKNMFSERTNIDDFVDAALDESKPMFTKRLIEKSMKSNRKDV